MKPIQVPITIPTILGGDSLGDLTWSAALFALALVFTPMLVDVVLVDI